MAVNIETLASEQVTCDHLAGKGVPIAGNCAPPDYSGTSTISWSYVDIGWGNGVLPYGAKTLPEQMLI